MDDYALAHSGPGTVPGGTVLDLLADRARSRPTDPYLTVVPAQGAPRTITFADLDAYSGHAAAWLRDDLGARRGDTVALIPGNDLPSVVTLFGVLRAGCSVLLLSPADPAARLRQQAGARDARLILRSPFVTADHSGLSTVAIAELDRSRSVGPGGIDPAADMFLFGTSGSTAASKMVIQSHRNAMANADAVRRHHALGRGQRVLGFLPIHHANAVHFMLVAPLVAGFHAILPHRFDPLRGFRLIEEYRPRIVSVVPSILEALLEVWREPAVPAQLEYFLSAAAPLTARTARDVVRAFDRPVLQGYGLTETTNYSTTMPAGLPAELYARLALDPEIPSAGVAVPCNEVAVLAPDGTPLGPGEVGEICIRGHHVMTGYAGDPVATADAFRGGWFHTQDLGYLRAEPGRPERYLVITGRTRNIAKVGGDLVSLDEMERVLRALPGVRDAVCWSVPDRLEGERIVAAVVYAGGEPVDVTAHLRRVFSAAAVPARVISVDRVPRTATGKIIRRDLAERLTT